MVGCSCMAQVLLGVLETFAVSALKEAKPQRLWATADLELIG